LADFRRKVPAGQRKRVKTKENILITALDLLNRDGEAAVSAVDIANAMEISPGNLYYHYKGKDEIIPALLSAFYEELQMVLSFASDSPGDLERYWTYVYIILEEIYDFRFLYLNIEHIVRTYPQTANRIRQILAAKRRAITLVLEGLERIGAIHVPAPLRDDVRETVLMAMTFWLQLDALDQSDEPKELRIHNAVYRIMTILLPYQTQGMADALSDLDEQLEAGATKAKAKAQKRP
jgi:AcrR family transcriptional regulator